MGSVFPGPGVNDPDPADNNAKARIVVKPGSGTSVLQAGDVDGPQLSDVRVARRVRPGRSVIAFTLDRPAQVTATFRRRSGGRYKKLGTKSYKGKAGKNRVRVPRKLKNKRLRRGSYRVDVRASSGGSRSALVRLSFRVG